MKRVSASTLSGLPNSRTPKPSAKTTLPSCTMPMATPGTSNCLPRVLDEITQAGDARRIERVRGLAREGFALVALGQQAIEDLLDLRVALLADVVGHVVDQHGPRAPITRRARRHAALVVRPRFRTVYARICSQPSRGGRSRGQLERPLRRRHRRRPTPPPPRHRRPWRRHRPGRCASRLRVRSGSPRHPPCGSTSRPAQ